MQHGSVRRPNDLLRRARESRLSPSGSGRPMSRQELADAASAYLPHPITAAYIGKLERGELRWPTKATREALRRVLGAREDRELGFYITRRPTTLPQTEVTADLSAVGATRLSHLSAPGLEDVVTILQRVHRRRRTIDPRIVTQLSDTLRHLVEGYDKMGHEILVPALVRHRTWLDSLLDDCTDLRQRRELFRIASGTSGLLGYVAVGHGSFPVARAYLMEAIDLADLAGDQDLRAWIRGTQSLVEYYAGNYGDALAYAEDRLAASPEVPPSDRTPGFMTRGRWADGSRRGPRMVSVSVVSNVDGCGCGS